MGFKGVKTGRRTSKLAIAATVAVLGGAGCYLKRDDLGELFEGSLVERAAMGILQTTTSFTKHFTDPNSDKLLPDWPVPNYPPDAPCPPTMVLDLEK